MPNVEKQIVYIRNVENVESSQGIIIIIIIHHCPSIYSNPTFHLLECSLQTPTSTICFLTCPSIITNNSAFLSSETQLSCTLFSAIILHSITDN